MMARHARSLAPLVAVLLLTACASAPVQRARQVSVDIHALLAGLDDAEQTLYTSHALASWTAERHQQFSAHMVVALKAGRGLNEGVRTIPLAPDAKADLTTVSAELEALTAIVKDALPLNSTVAVSLTAAKDAVLQLLPLFLS